MDCAKKAALASLLYLELCRAAMRLVGRRYLGAEVAGRGRRRAVYIQLKLGVKPQGAPTTIEVAHVLPLIEKAARLMDDITTLVHPVLVVPQCDIESTRREAM